MVPTFDTYHIKNHNKSGWNKKSCFLFVIIVSHLFILITCLEHYTCSYYMPSKCVIIKLEL